MTRPDLTATPHVVNMDVVGPLTVYVQGELDKFRDSVVFLTVHNTGASFNSWLEFAAGSNMEDIRRRALFLHVALPGQEPEAEDLPSDYTFPSMEAIGLNLVTVLDSLRVKQVVGLGDGAGANILLRFAMNHPTRLHGIFLINTEGIATIQEKLVRQTTKLTQPFLFLLPTAGKERWELWRGAEQKVRFLIYFFGGDKLTLALVLIHIWPAMTEISSVPHFVIGLRQQFSFSNIFSL